MTATSDHEPITADAPQFSRESKPEPRRSSPPSSVRPWVWALLILAILAYLGDMR